MKSEESMVFQKSLCSCTGIHLEKLVQPAVLALLAKQPLHGYVIVQQLQYRYMYQKRKPDPSGVYRHLKQMEERNLVESAWDTESAGQAKRCYAMTEKGAECLKTWISTIKKYQEFLQEFLVQASQDGKDVIET